MFQIRVEFKNSKMEYKMSLFGKIVHGYAPSTIFVKNLHLRRPIEFEYHSANSEPLLTFSKSQTADLPIR